RRGLGEELRQCQPCSDQSLLDQALFQLLAEPALHLRRHFQSTVVSLHEQSEQAQSLIKRPLRPGRFVIRATTMVGRMLLTIAQIILKCACELTEVMTVAECFREPGSAERLCESASIGRDVSKVLDEVLTLTGRIPGVRVH